MEEVVSSDGRGAIISSRPEPDVQPVSIREVIAESSIDRGRMCTCTQNKTAESDALAENTFANS